MTTGLVPPPPPPSQYPHPYGPPPGWPAANGPPPAPSPRVRPPDPDPRSSRRFVVGLLVAGLAVGGLTFGVRLTSVGAALALLVLVVSVVAALSLPPRRAFAPLLLAVAFVPWLAVRASPWLVTLDVLAATVGVLGALTFASGGSCLESARGLLRRGWRVVESSLLAWGPAGRQVRVAARGHGAGGSALLALLPALIVTVLLVGLVTVLLSTGDALFASFVHVGGLFDSLSGRLLLAVVGGAAFAILHSVGRAARREGESAARPVAPARAFLVVLSGLCVVYGFYVLVQVSAVLLGPAYVERRTGLTYAEYARQGFFQLLAVAVITLVAVSLARPVAAASGALAGHGVRLLALVAVCCTEVMVVVSILRLQMYSDAFGLTMLRLYTTVFAGWVGLVLALAAIALWLSPREWLAPTVVALALLGVFVMNIVNPEALVAKTNLARAEQTGRLDAWYLQGLSTDAVPTIVAHPPSPGVDASGVLRAWCLELPDAPQGLAWTWSRQQAHDRLVALCH